MHIVLKASGELVLRQCKCKTQIFIYSFYTVFAMRTKCLRFLFVVICIVVLGCIYVKGLKQPKDYSSHPDVVFLVQRAGVSEEDFESIKKFVGMSIHMLGVVSETQDSSRVGLALFTGLTRHPIDFQTCCLRGRAHLQYLIDKEVSLQTNFVLRKLDRGDHSDLSPDSIDVRNAFKNIRDMYLSEGMAQLKPTLIVFIANFQTPYASFRLLHDAFDEIEACKAAGGWIMAVIVDSLPNRQPRMSPDLILKQNENNRRKRFVGKSTKTQDRQKELRNFIQRKDVINEENYRKHLKDIFERADNSKLQIAKIENTRIEPKIYYEGLTSLYAKDIASRPSDGFVIRSFADLVISPVPNALERLLVQPMSWFGEAEVRATCDNTKHLIEKAIWSPSFYIADKYPDGSHCYWLIKARPGYSLGLRFDEFQTEEIFDKISIYDGSEPDMEQLLGTFSGPLRSSKKLPVVNSTEESMLVAFQTDGGNNGRGFHARWTPHLMFNKIDDADVVFLIDVSSSLLSDDFSVISAWVKLTTKYFSFSEEAGADNKRLFGTKESVPSRFGLLKFASKTTVLSSISDASKTRERFYSTMDGLSSAMDSTYIGYALDFARLKQFDLTSKKSALGRLLSGSSTDGEKDPIIPRKILFIISDGYSVDDPKPSAKRLCESDIIPVLIGVGKVNIRGRSDIISYCGLTFTIRTPVTEVIHTLKKHLKIIKNETVTTTTIPPLPTTPVPPTRTTTLPTTTTTTTTQSTTTTSRPTTKFSTLPSPAQFNYFGLAVLLIAVGIVEGISLATLIYFDYDVRGYPLSKVLFDDASFSYGDKSLSGGDDLDDNDSKPPTEESVNLKKHKFQLPTVVNSFFTRNRTDDTKNVHKEANLETNSSKKCCKDSNPNKNVLH